MGSMHGQVLTAVHEIVPWLLGTDAISPGAGKLGLANSLKFRHARCGSVGWWL